MDLKFGCDPEVFIYDEKHSLFISAHDIIPGSKDEPFKVDCGAVQPDGLAAEFNIDAVDNAEDWEKNISTVLGILTDMVKKEDPNYVLRFQSVADFDPEYFKSLPAKVKVLGCDPDFNALTGGVNPNPADTLLDQPIRTAAGHVHIGWTDGQELIGAHIEDCKFIARYFLYNDWFVPKTTHDHRRLHYYGGHGSFRPKSYGVELRAASNWWVETADRRRGMFNAAKGSMMEIARQTEYIRKAA